MDENEEFDQIVGEIDRFRNTIVGLLAFSVVCVCLTAIIIAVIVH